MPTYKPNKKNICNGFMADREGESGLQYFVEHDGENVILLCDADYIQLPRDMKVLCENQLNWVRLGNELPNTTSRENIIEIEELNINPHKLNSCSITQELKETDKGKYLRKLRTLTRKEDVYIRDDHALILQKAMVDNKDFALYIDSGKRAKIYLMGENEKVHACVPEFIKEQQEIPFDEDDKDIIDDLTGEVL